MDFRLYCCIGDCAFVAASDIIVMRGVDASHSSCSCGLSVVWQSPFAKAIEFSFKAKASKSRLEELQTHNS
jgi:hypothetical protein